MAIKTGTIEEIRKKVDDMINNGENQDLENDIDHMRLEDVKEQIQTYWNESVKELEESLKKKLGINFGDDRVPSQYDAGLNFEQGKISSNLESNFVNPDKNKNNIRYLQEREDYNEDVLKNKKNLDFTQEQKIEDVFNNMTRLIMPQYKRGVEIEDLDRNFWVIGQNLTWINQFLSDLSDKFINNLLEELVGIWNNIYRLWQALAAFEKKMKEGYKNEKLRVVLNYNALLGLGDFTHRVTGPEVLYASYNEYIDKVLEGNPSQESLVNSLCGDKGVGKPLRIDTDITYRKLTDILNMIKARNFYIITKDDSNICDVVSLVWQSTIENHYYNSGEHVFDGLFEYNYNLPKEHLWIDFVSEPLENGEQERKILTYSELDFLRKDLIHRFYDINISIPSDIINVHKYEDLIRINKPYPNLYCITWGNPDEHINSINNNENWLAYSENKGARTYSCLDGFFMAALDDNYTETFKNSPLDPIFASDNKLIELSENIVETYFDQMNRSAWAKINGAIRVSNKNFSNIGDNLYVHPNVLTREFASSDMIDCKHSEKGQTRYNNMHLGINFPSYNERFLNGIGEFQNIEYLSTKDQTNVFLKINPIIEPEYIKIGYITLPKSLLLEQINNGSISTPVIVPEKDLGQFMKDDLQGDPKYKSTLRLFSDEDKEVTFSLDYKENNLEYVESERNGEEIRRLNIEQLWKAKVPQSETLVSELIEQYCCNKYKDKLRNYQYKIIVCSISVNPWMDYSTDYRENENGERELYITKPAVQISGSLWAYLGMIYKEKDIVNFKKICNLGISENNFGGSELEKYVRNYLLDIDGNGTQAAGYGLEMAYTSFNGNTGRFGSIDVLLLKDIDFNLNTHTLNSATITYLHGSGDEEEATFKTSGVLRNEEWDISENLGCPLKSYNCKTDSAQRDPNKKLSTDIYVRINPEQAENKSDDFVTIKKVERGAVLDKDKTPFNKYGNHWE